MLVKPATQHIGILAAASLLLGCGGRVEPKPVPFLPTPIFTGTCLSGALHVEVWSLPPQPFANTSTNFKLGATDASGTPVTGLDIAVQPILQMTNSVFPTTSAVAIAGDGTYEVTGIKFTDEGEWSLNLIFSGALTGSCTTRSFSVLPGAPDGP